MPRVLAFGAESRIKRKQAPTPATYHDNSEVVQAPESYGLQAFYHS